MIDYLHYFDCDYHSVSLCLQVALDPNDPSSLILPLRIVDRSRPPTRADIDASMRNATMLQSYVLRNWDALDDYNSLAPAFASSRAAAMLITQHLDEWTDASRPVPVALYGVANMWATKFGHVTQGNNGPQYIEHYNFGYCTIRLGGTTLSVHRCVLAAYNPREDESEYQWMTGNHKDHNRSNNAINNLNWMTLAANTSEASQGVSKFHSTRYMVTMSHPIQGQFFCARIADVVTLTGLLESTAYSRIKFGEVNGVTVVAIKADNDQRQRWFAAHDRYRATGHRSMTDTFILRILPGGQQPVMMHIVRQALQ